MSQININKDLEEGEIDENELPPLDVNINKPTMNNRDLEEGEIIEEGEQATSEPPPNSKEILLKLGDIILISDPTNEILNDNVFLIEYIDSKKVKLINSETLEKTILPISSTGVIGDGSIQSIKILSSHPKNGYARQNDLLPGTWINIYFGGEMPMVITGKITNLEEDMIEVRTTDGDTIYINFDYHGIPDDLPIETFEIRPSIKEPTVELNADELVEMGQEEEEEEAEQIQILQPQKQVGPNKTKTNSIFIDFDDLVFGESVHVEEMVNIEKEKYRFNIGTQTNDLLEELISEVPANKRTNNVLNSIHIMITRFIQLRQTASTFDKHNNIDGIIKKTAEDRPLADYLAEFKNTLYWVLLVSKNIKKIYPIKQQQNHSGQSNFDDYEEILQDENLIAMEALFKNYRSNQGVEGQNKYSNLYYSLDPYLTPFFNTPISENNSVFTDPRGIIIEGQVATNIHSIVDSLGNDESTVVAESAIANRRFVIQKYNLGETRLQAPNLKGSNMIAHRVKLTNNDTISVSSILTLPEPTVRFSQVNLPSSNLLVRANLNLEFLNYWQLLKQKTQITPITIDGLDNELEYDDSNFVDNIKQYFLNLTEYEKPEDLSNLDIYKIFLRTIIPKIRVLFSLVKKYIKGRLSLVEVVNYLEPFMIYTSDLTYMQYKEINTFILDKIRDYNRVYREYNIAFSNLKFLRSIGKRRITSDNEKYVYYSPLYEVLDQDIDTYIKTMVFEHYGINDLSQINCSPSEFLKKITVTDFGNLFNTAVALTNIQLMYPTALTSILDADKDRLAKIMEKDKDQSKCATFIIAKKYYSVAGLEEDNNKPIFYDKDYDTTNYNLINDKYKRQQDQLNPEDFLLFLTDEFVKKHKMDEQTAEYMATTLVNQAKAVREGDYALLVNTDDDNSPRTLDYYVRNNNIWVLDDKVDPNSFIEDNDILCNLEFSCIYNPQEKTEDKCESVAVAKDKIVNNALKQVMDQFDKKYDISKDELNTQIKKHLEYYTKIFDKLQNIKSVEFYKYNNQKYNLGMEIADEMKAKVVSPYSKLRDLIMGQNDIVKRQTDIIRFVSLYCREGNPEIPNINDGEMENEWWLYCRETNTKLLPKFVHILADTFISKNSQYNEVLEDLKRRIGKIGDDGDAWVDEHSGEVICYTDYDETEGYKDGFINRSHDVLVQDIGDVIVENQIQRSQSKDKDQEKIKKRLSAEGQLTSNIISVLSVNMGINIEDSRDFIIKIVTELMNDTDIIKKEPVYKKMEEEAAKKGKKLPSYSTVYGSTLMYLTLGMYLIAIQTSIPSIQTRKTMPGCVRSFMGFPLGGEGDDSGLNYVACVALKSRDPSTLPWNVLPKNEEKIEATTKSFIVRYLLPLGDVRQKMTEKTEYLLIQGDQEIPQEYNVVNWKNFLPPLRRFHIRNLENIGDGFMEDLQHNIFTGNHRQLEKLLVVESKIIGFSLAIQEEIQQLVDRKNLLLKSAGQIFMDNACCNEAGKNSLTSFKYFINENRNIEQYNNIVYHLSGLLNDVKILTKSAMMLSEVDTKRVYSVISTAFSEETIYYAFISLCKFHSSVPLDAELLPICREKPDYLSKMETIQEKIAKLKRDGRNYTEQQFLRLFQIVCRHNIIHISLEKTNKSCIERINNVLTKLDRENSETVPKVFIQRLEALIENYDVTMREDSKDMRLMKDYLAASNESMKREIKDFIRSKARVSSLELKNISKFIDELTIWKADQMPRKLDIKITDDTLNNYTTYFKNMVSLISVVFPNMIINKQTQSINPPKYWGVSPIHATDIKEMVSSFYKPLDRFYGNPTIINVLREITQTTMGINKLAKYTPILNAIKIAEEEVYTVFDKRMVTLLYEYYLLSVLNEYISLTKDPSVVKRMLVIPNTGSLDQDESDIFSGDVLVEQQLRLGEQEQDMIEGDVIKLKQDVANLLVGFINIMMKTKKTINKSYQDVEDRIFKLKEAEKHTFTDRLKSMSEEERAVDTVLKHNKLGPLYSIGLSKGIREYDPENFEHDKQVAEKVAEIQNRLRRERGTQEMDMDDMANEINEEHDIEMDLAMGINRSEDYDDGDPWGDEAENYDDYN